MVSPIPQYQERFEGAVGLESSIDPVVVGTFLTENKIYFVRRTDTEEERLTTADFKDVRQFVGGRHGDHLANAQPTLVGDA
jgi:hypothetical protein